MINPATPTSTAGHGLLPLHRRGRLRNGATPGDFLAALRCGARTRCGGACRQPAMANGRCRLHGGLSTGPRTPEGRARCARARTIHGGYSAEVRALQAEARHHIQRLRFFRLRLTAGRGVLPQETKIHHRGHRDSASSPARAARNNPSSSVLSVSSVVKSSLPSQATAGHGVLPRKQSLMQRLLLGSSALGVSVRPAAVTAGHGVLSSKQVNHGAAKTQSSNTPPAPRPAPASSASPRLRGDSSVQRPAPTVGHGVLPSRRSLMQRTLLGCTALGVSVRPAAVTAGHGVLSPIGRRVG